MKSRANWMLWGKGDCQKVVTLCDHLHRSGPGQ